LLAVDERADLARHVPENVAVLHLEDLAVARDEPGIGDSDIAVLAAPDDHRRLVESVRHLLAVPLRLEDAHGCRSLLLTRSLVPLTGPPTRGRCRSHIRPLSGTASS